MSCPVAVVTVNDDSLAPGIVAVVVVADVAVVVVVVVAGWHSSNC